MASKVENYLIRLVKEKRFTYTPYTLATELMKLSKEIHPLGLTREEANEFCNKALERGNKVWNHWILLYRLNDLFGTVLTKTEITQ